MARAQTRQELSRRAISSFVWSFASFMSQKVLVFASMAVIGRYLDKPEVGIVAVALAIMAYLWRLNDVGMSDALVQRADAHEPQIASTVFWLTMAIGVVLFVGLWLSAPWIGGLVSSDPILVDVIRALSFTFLIGAFTGTQRGLIKHDLLYRRMFIPQVTSGLIKGALSIVLAVLGAGVWSLVVGQLAGMAALAVGLFMVSDWRPSLRFSAKDIPSLARFGIGITGLGIVAEAIVNVDYLIVGGKLGLAAVGLYYFAFRLPDLLIGSISQVAWEVLFPLYSRLKDLESAEPESESESLRRGYLTTVRLGALAIFPAAAGIAVLAEPLIVVLLGEKWRAGAGAMAFIALYSASAAISGMSGTIFKALGRTMFMTVNSTLYLVVLAPALWFAADYGITAVAATHLVVQLLVSVYLAVVVDRVLGVRPTSMLGAAKPGLIGSLGMVVAVVPVAYFLDPIPAVALGIPLGIVAYLGMLKLFFPRDLALVLGMFARFRGRAGQVSVPDVI